MTLWLSLRFTCAGQGRRRTGGPCDGLKKRGRKETNVLEESANNYADSSNWKHVAEREKGLCTEDELTSTLLT